MPIKSYLAHPHKGAKQQLVAAISALAQCDVYPAENEDLLIVVTETENKAEEKHLQEQLDAIDSLKLLAMVSGFNTPKKN